MSVKLNIKSVLYNKQSNFKALFDFKCDIYTEGILLQEGMQDIISFIFLMHDASKKSRKYKSSWFSANKNIYLTKLTLKEIER